MNKYIFAVYLLLSISFAAIGQETFTIKGKVTEASGEGLPGATVQIKGTINGVVTDMDGQFSLSVTEGDVLIFSFLGFATQEIAITNQTVIDVELSPDIETLQEVVVQTGFGTIRKSDLTGAVSSVDVSKIEDLPVPDITQALQGRVAGVQITQNSGAPGDGTSIRIRGTGSINSGSAPLFVVDGIIVNSINYLSQNDIKSLEVMKDASVAALYGSRAANGVVVITTKQGEVGKTQVSFGAQVGVLDFWKTLDLMDAREYQIMVGLENGGDVSSLEGAYNQLIDPENPLEDNDWVDLITRRGFRQQYNVAFSGGTNDMTYRFSANYFDETGIIIGSDFQRLNLTNDLTFNVSDRLKFRANIIYSTRDRNVQNTSSQTGRLRQAIITRPTLPVIADDGFPNNTPLTRAEENVDIREDNNFNVKLFMYYNFSEHLKFQSRFGFDQEVNQRSRFDPPDPRVEFISNPLSVARVTENRNNDYKWNWDQVLTYDRRIDDHGISLTSAFTFERKINSDINGSGISALGRDITTAYLVNASRDFDVGGNPSNWSQIGGIFRASYNFKAKYFAQFSMRADGSSRFAKGNQWGYFPSASLAWFLSDDLFAESAVVTSTKLRVVYGQLGNNRIGNYETFTILNNTGQGTYLYGTDDNFNFFPGYSPNRLGNPSITWEKTTTYGLGLDIDLFENVSIVADVFRRLTTDLLLEEPVPGSTGLVDNPRRNVGDVTNDGIELSIAYERQAGPWTFDLSLNGTYLINTVQRLGDAGDPIFGGEINNAVPGGLGFVTKTVEGRPIGSFFGRVVERLYTAEDFENNALLPSLPQTLGYVPEVGDFKFADLNGDGVVSNEDRTFLGSAIPTYNFGAVFNVSFKNWDLSAAFQGVADVSVFNVLRYQTHAYNGTNALAGLTQSMQRNNLDLAESNLPQDIIDDYSGPNSNPTLPESKTANNEDSYRFASDFYVEDASYVRLKNLTIGYTFSPEVISKINFSSLKIYITGQNLITWTEYEGLDPELGNQQALSAGIDFGAYPQARLFMVGLNATF